MQNKLLFFFFSFFFLGGMVGISFRLFLGEDRIDNVVIFMLQCYPFFLPLMTLACCLPKIFVL
jgi:hypothetical protein